MHDLSELLDLATRLGGDAGTLLLGGMARRRQDIGTKTSDTDMVTEMDHASERLIVEGILAVRPDDAILGEEGSRRDGSSGVRWVIDPLDGTTNYLYGVPAFTVSIAAEVDGEGAVGVVVDPTHGEVFTAVRGGGAHCNGVPIRVSGASDLTTALVATGFSYLTEERGRQAAVVQRVLPAVRDIRRMGAASLDLCAVACGRVDAYYEAVLQPWDVAAGIVIAVEAGATVEGLDGGPPTQGSVLAATPALAEPLRRLVRAAPA
jgi:myo-inositol-1(or 4)-monophosphatase